MLTAERLRELLRYDPPTGRFTWLIDRGVTTKAGSPAGTIYRDGGRYISVDGQRHPAARLAWLYMTGKFPPADIDHKNLDRADDRFDNLRPATRAQNLQNRRRFKNNASGRKGVTWNTTTQKWHAAIYVDGQSIHLGCFDDVVVAGQAYDAAAKQHFGEFARSA